jgi:tetratricopeptide (TPR) repeat protein
MKKYGVTYIAFLREWFRVVNQNPLFSTVDVSNFEIMEVFKFIPDKTHILPSEVKERNMYALEIMSRRNQKEIQQALQVLQGSLAIDPQSSLTYYLIANAYIMLNDRNNFERNLLKALEIFPEYKEALFQFGNYYKSTNKTDEAKNYLERYLKVAPDDKKALELYKSIDTVKVK